MTTLNLKWSVSAMCCCRTVPRIVYPREIRPNRVRKESLLKREIPSVMMQENQNGIHIFIC